MASKDLKERLKKRPIAEEHSVRDGYTMLQSDLELLKGLVERYNDKGARTCKAEVVRIAIQALAKLPDEQVLEMLCKLPKSPVGRRRDDSES
jgi:hypothetical protein